jgi:hypothetical protein
MPDVTRPIIEITAESSGLIFDRSSRPLYEPIDENIWIVSKDNPDQPLFGLSITDDGTGDPFGRRLFIESHRIWTGDDSEESTQPEFGPYQKMICPLRYERTLSLIGGPNAQPTIIPPILDEDGYLFYTYSQGYGQKNCFTIIEGLSDLELRFRLDSTEDDNAYTFKKLDFTTEMGFAMFGFNTRDFGDDE